MGGGVGVVNGDWLSFAVRGLFVFSDQIRAVDSRLGIVWS